MLAILYFINCFTPFRLTNDTVRYFAIKETMEGSWPEEFGARNDFLPPGYAYFLMALSKSGILNSFTICFIQLLFLAGSLNYVRKIFAPALPVFTFIIFSLLNWTTLKFTITPLSEMQFLFFTTGALYYFHRFNQAKKWGWLFVTAIFCFLAILTRTAGVLLAISLLLSLVVNKGTRSKAVVILLAIVVVAGLIIFFTQPKFIRYLGYFMRPFTTDPVAFFTNNILRHLQDWAELFINAPLSKTVYISYLRIVYMLAGLFFMVITLSRVFGKKFSIPVHIRIYLVGYVLLIFNWPFYEARFWFPVLPLLAAILLLPKNSVHPVFRPIVSLYKLYYVLTGIFVMGYYTWLSYNKDAMAKLHDAGKWEREYRIHFFNEKSVDTTYDKKALYLLDKYD